MIFAKIAADLDSHPRIRRAGRDGREVFLFVLRRNAALDLNGRIPAIHLEPWYVADQLMVTEQEAVSGLSRAVTAGLLVQEEGFYVIPGWDDEWAKRPLTEAERKQRQRAKTNTSPTESRNVTNVSGHESDCPESHALDKSREEERRVAPPLPAQPVLDKIQEHFGDIGVAKALGKRPRPKREAFPLPADWQPTPEHENTARERGVDLDLQARKFRAHAEANGRTCKVWNAAFTQWLLGSFPDRQQSNSSTTAIRKLERLA